VVLSLSALEGSIEALPVLRSGSAGSNGDDDALLNMDLQHVRHYTERQRERERGDRLTCWRIARAGGPQWAGLICFCLCLCVLCL
jgi:hypothetical protein